MSAGKRKPAKKNRFVESEAVRRERRRRRRRTFLFGTGLFCLAAVCSALCVLSYAWLTQTPLFKARFVIVSGNRTVSHGEVLDTADIRSGDNIFGINLDVARTRLSAHPWIDTASVIREFPNRIIIRVTEHTPVAVAEIGHPYLINSRGEIFEKGGKAFAGLPVFKNLKRGSLPLSGHAPSGGNGPVEREIKEIIPLLGRLTQKGGRFVMTGAIADPDTGLRLLTEGATQTIDLGFGHYDKKIKRVNELFALLEKKVNLTAVAAIDVSDPNSVVIKPAKS
ncbi:cell division protein FtsQ/DivIB [Desulfoluna spongiiphila]|uniref:Cell division septal protein FtsQ n=1 Tax=Desulfoluna spongiiphila TaxID=419481 RepID=A0A1G5AC58_9BACT|nr:FtsQ-type POTRA domain-containing protein [Desulfoluna spongiiphila]SCX75467.1 Cell division septal protein FtsQ [Desulfoluna spongiiphila]